MSKSDEGGSSGGEDDDWDCRSSSSVATSASSWASSSLGRVQHGALASGSACGTMGSEGGGERGRSGIADGCDVRGPSGSCGVVVEGGAGGQWVFRGLGWEQAAEVPWACDGVSSDKAGSGTVCLGSESVGGGDG